MTAAAEAKKMTCRAGTGGSSNIPFGCFYRTWDEVKTFSNFDQANYITRQNPSLPCIYSDASEIDTT